LSASPERFIKKSLNKLYSQPIKGTVRRAQDDAEDEKLKSALLASEKERAENLMIVDLVRNDLAKSSETGSVEVTELFGRYSFKQVHQMISTVSSTIIDGLNPVTAIANAFPMGSMTGAPKVMAMQLIEQYENSKRGLYSGAIGYFAPNEDFDFNVVIRSIQYNEERQYVNFEVGSAITIDSHAEQEYEECLLKASAMLRALGGINYEA
jgi:para-aminobenzoate synthetase component 1